MECCSKLMLKSIKYCPRRASVLSGMPLARSNGSSGAYKGLCVMRIELEEVRETGWTWGQLDGGSDDELREQLISLSLVLGNPIPCRNRGQICESLRPTDASRASRKSLSARHSFGAFPCHNDTAHWTRPSSFVLLACLEPGSDASDTLLLDIKSLPLGRDSLRKLHETPFRVVNGRHSFFSTIMHRDRDFVRYDPGCMFPLHVEEQAILDILRADRWTGFLHSFQWSRKKFLLIDNWRMLHGRSAIGTNAVSRHLIRIYVQERSNESGFRL